MKSVDRDFDRNGFTGADWLSVSYVFVAFIAFVMFTAIWHEVHLQGLSFNTIFRIVSFPVIYLFPLISSLGFRRYIRSASKENLISERVASNCEIFLGKQLTVVYLVIMLLVTWELISK
jgi:hypothetical protein